MEEKLNLRLDGTLKLVATTKFWEVVQDFREGEKKMTGQEKLKTTIPSGSRVMIYKYDDEIQRTDSFGETKTVILLPTFELRVTNEKFGIDTTINGQDYLTDEQRDLALVAVCEKMRYGWEEIVL